MKNKNTKKGFALITVLVILIMIALGTAAVLQSVGSHASMKSISVEETKNQYLAEAGMQHALWKCRTNGGVCVNETITIDGTSVKIDVTENPAGSKKYDIKVTAV